MSEISRFEGSHFDMMNTINEFKDGIWCVRSIRDGKHCSLIAENIEDYPTAFKEAQFLPYKNNIAKAVYKVLNGVDDDEMVTARKLTNAVMKALRDELVYVDTSRGNDA